MIFDMNYARHALSFALAAAAPKRLFPRRRRALYTGFCAIYITQDMLISFSICSPRRFLARLSSPHLCYTYIRFLHTAHTYAYRHIAVAFIRQSTETRRVSGRAFFHSRHLKHVIYIEIGMSRHTAIYETDAATAGAASPPPLFLRAKARRLRHVASRRAFLPSFFCRVIPRCRHISLSAAR